MHIKPSDVAKLAAGGIAGRITSDIMDSTGVTGVIDDVSDEIGDFFSF